MIDIVYRYDPDTSEPLPPPATPAEARARLCDGNREFVSLVDLPADKSPLVRIIPFDLSELGKADLIGTAPTQRPFAVVLGCSDARVPTELVFNQACNALFVVRVAGNVLGAECLGSIEYAVRNLGDDLKLLVVLGHSGCGAVSAAVDIFLNPTRYLKVACSHSLRAIVDGLLVAVRTAAYSLEQLRGPDAARCPGYRPALIELSVALNAALIAKTLLYEFQDISAGLQIVYGVYHLISREVNLPAGVGKTGTPTLFDPPENEEEFAQLGLHLAGCEEIKRLLECTV